MLDSILSVWYNVDTQKVLAFRLPLNMCKCFMPLVWVDVAIDTAIGVGTSVLAYGLTYNASKAADDIICKGANRIVRGMQRLNVSKYGKGAVKRGMQILDSGITKMNTVRGASSVIGSVSAGLLSAGKSIFKRLF